MQGLILAAGKGTRMGNIEMPKCLLEINGIPIIKHQINSSYGEIKNKCRWHPCPPIWECPEQIEEIAYVELKNHKIKK